MKHHWPGSIERLRASMELCRQSHGALGVLSVALVLVALATPAAAKLCDYDDSHAWLISPPADLRQGSLESNDRVFVFSEKSRLLLTSGITVNAQAPGSYKLSDLDVPLTIATGIEIDSDYIHFDKVNGPYRTVTAYLFFCEPILGVVGKRSDLRAGHPLFGSLLGITYPDTADAEGIEEQFDSFTIFAVSGDPPGEYRGLKVSLKVADGVDSLRVITKASPPGT